jgi:hypothetical protein
MATGNEVARATVAHGFTGVMTARQGSHPRRMRSKIVPMRSPVASAHAITGIDRPAIVTIRLLRLFRPCSLRVAHRQLLGS